MTAKRAQSRRAGKEPGAVPETGARWPADAVERRPVVALVPFARNARSHSDEQVAQIAASIREWGWTMPVLVDDPFIGLNASARKLIGQAFKYMGDRTSRIVGENGAAVVPFGVPGTGPVPLRKIQRALEYRVSR